MKRSTGQWVVTVMAATLIAAPAAAQTAPPTQPPTTAQPTAPPQAAPQTASSANEHLRAASAALNDVQVANLSARAKTQVNELKRRLTALERVGASPSATAKAPASRVNWGTEVAAMDKVLTSLLGSESAATGTSGTTTSAAGAAGSSRGKAAAAVSLDETSRAKLTEVRTHLTAYATAMAGGTQSATPPATPDPATAPPGATTGAQPPTTTQPPAGSTPPAPPGSTTATPAQAPPGSQADMTTAKKHLTEARNTLSSLTQLPAAAQLAGEARTQVSQLISNFNELITTDSNWRDSYAKVNANMTALLGAETAAVAAATGTSGAVGTSGSGAITLDPTVREKLVEMRKHLAEFEKAAGGGASAPATNVNVEDPPATPPTPPAATSATGTTGTTGTTATPPATAGTSGTTPAPAPATPEAETQRAQADWMKHVTAIEAMLKSQDESGGVTLDKAKVEMLRTHLAEIRKLLDRK